MNGSTSEVHPRPGPSMPGGVYHTGMLGKRGQHLFAGFDDRSCLGCLHERLIDDALDADSLCCLWMVLEAACDGGCSPEWNDTIVS